MLALKYLTDAGYDPHGAVRFLQTMSRNAELSSLAAPSEEAADDSHPSYLERLIKAQRIADLYAGPTASGHQDWLFLGPHRRFGL